MRKVFVRFCLLAILSSFSLGVFAEDVPVVVTGGGSGGGQINIGGGTMPAPEVIPAVNIVWPNHNTILVKQSGFWYSVSAEFPAQLSTASSVRFELWYTFSAPETGAVQTYALIRKLGTAPVIWNEKGASNGYANMETSVIETDSAGWYYIRGVVLDSAGAEISVANGELFRMVNKPAVLSIDPGDMALIFRAKGNGKPEVVNLGNRFEFITDKIFKSGLWWGKVLDREKAIKPTKQQNLK